MNRSSKLVVQQTLDALSATVVHDAMIFRTSQDSWWGYYCPKTRKIFWISDSHIHYRYLNIPHSINYSKYLNFKADIKIDENDMIQAYKNTIHSKSDKLIIPDYEVEI